MAYKLAHPACCDFVRIDLEDACFEDVAEEVFKKATSRLELLGRHKLLVVMSEDCVLPSNEFAFRFIKKFAKRYSNEVSLALVVLGESAECMRLVDSIARSEGLNQRSFLDRPAALNWLAIQSIDYDLPVVV